MDDFDRLLEFQLRRKLDGVVAAPVPVRRGRAGLGRLTKGHREEPTKKSVGINPHPAQAGLARIFRAFVEIPSFLSEAGAARTRPQLFPLHRRI